LIKKTTKSAVHISVWNYPYVEFEYVRRALENVEKLVEGRVRTYNELFSKTNPNAQTAETTGMGEIKDGEALMISK